LDYEKKLKILKDKFSEGETTIEYLNETRYHIEDVKERIIVIKNSNEILISSLKYLLGKDQKYKLNIKREFKFEKFEIPIKVSSKMLLNRPDIKVSLNSIILNRELVRIAKTSYFPEFYLTTSYGYNSKKLSNLIRNYNSLYNLTFKFLESVFDFGKRRNIVKISEKQLEVANLNFTNTLYKALKEINQSIVTYKNLLKKREKNLIELKTLQKILFTQKDKFKNGLIPVEKLFDLKINILQKRMELLETEKEIYDALIKVYKALGY